MISSIRVIYRRQISMPPHWYASVTVHNTTLIYAVSGDRLEAMSMLVDELIRCKLPLANTINIKTDV